VEKHPFVPSSWNSAKVLLRNDIPSPGDPDDGIVLPVVVVCQDDDQLLKIISRHEEATALLGSYFNRGGEVLDPVGVRNKPITEGLEAQDNVPASY